MKNIIFVPIGSYEQHGPHLPPDTDYLIANKIVEFISPIFNGKMIEGIKISLSHEHEGFKDTKFISKKVFINRIETILTGFNENTRFIFINAHGGNAEVLNSIQKLKTEKMLVINTFSVIKDQLMEMRSSAIGGICHAGEFETSLMLYLYPKKVRMNKLKKSDSIYIPAVDPNYNKEKLKNWKTIDLSESGILGDPFHASVEKGEYWFKSIIEVLKDLIGKFI